MLQFFHIPNLFSKRIFADPVASKFVGYWDGGTFLGNVIDSSFHKFWPIHFRATGKVWPRWGAVFFRMFSWTWWIQSVQTDPIMVFVILKLSTRTWNGCQISTIGRHCRNWAFHNRMHQARMIDRSEGFCWCKDRKSWYFLVRMSKILPLLFLKDT